MRVGRSKASLTSDLTVDGDLDFLTLYQIKQLASPASGEALRKGSAEIADAEIAVGAAIAEAKLALAYATGTLFTKVGTDIGTHAGVAAAHHTKTIDASQLTAGILALARLSGITNTQIAAAADIVYSKLNLALGIVDGDVSATAAIARSKLDFGDGLVNADIADAAAIVLSKIVNTYLLPTIMTTRGDLVYRGASYPGRIPASDEGKVLTMGAADPGWITLPDPTKTWLYNTLAEDNLFGVEEATVADFQATPAAGDFFNNPAGINDNNTGVAGSARTIDQYAEVDYGKLVVIKRWRQFGTIEHNGDGEWKIQYWSLATEAWEDWVTGISTRATADWSELTTETPVYTTKVRLVAVIIDTKFDPDTSYMYELEVYY